MIFPSTKFIYRALCCEVNWREMAFVWSEHRLALRGSSWWFFSWFLRETVLPHRNARAAPSSFVSLPSLSRKRNLMAWSAGPLCGSREKAINPRGSGGQRPPGPRDVGSMENGEAPGRLENRVAMGSRSVTFPVSRL